MVKRGISKLPISVKIDEALQILEILSQVNHKIGRLEEKFNHSIVSEALVQILSLSESVESTRIEGTQVTFTDMVEEQNDHKPRWEIKEVDNYQRALQEGYERIRNGYPISSRLIKELHEILMQDARGSTQSSGAYRKVQNFIGPTNRIEDATYIPVSAEKIDEFMENLEYFINHHPYNEKLSTSHITEKGYIFNEDANPFIKTAIMHAQFESIHPFLDGNGRLGRILIVLSLMESKVITQPIFFVSEELEKERARYYDMLNGVRGDVPKWGDWILFFINACNRMAERINRKLEHAETLAKKGLSLCELSSERKVWLYTFSDPFTNAKKVSEKLDISANTARKALHSLVEKKLLFTDSEVRRNKKYRNYDLMRILRD
ncbi:Adenosine monophosphate-protein transferase SoFic [Paraliobacillus sp. PM-2]|uniref:Fic family protein n=1 Tax=Paraliobacillus sp. PM-2 TaxID=1462524 RepID=UPI00061BE2F9|nr:Fic family protein [Paraliobacillus sp. PM-2]CQR46279.1 Adenosine monophosphate-protein transferase SoFic [Paraliobacillus sp. PM-2]